MQPGHLAGLDGLQRPAFEGHVVARRVLLHVVVPTTGRRLVADDTLKRNRRGLLGVRVLGHAVGLGERIGADEVAVFGATGAAEVTDAVGVHRLRVNKILDGLLDGFAEFLGPGRFAVREIGENGKCRVRDVTRPVALCRLILLEPTESLQDRALGRRVTIAAATTQKRTAHARRAGARHRLHHDRRLDERDGILRCGLHRNGFGRRRRVRRHDVRDGADNRRVDLYVDLLVRRYDFLRFGLFFLLQLDFLLLNLRDVDLNHLLALPGNGRDDNEGRDAQRRQQNRQKRRREALQLCLRQLVLGGRLRLRQAGEHLTHPGEKAFLFECRVDLGLMLLEELLRRQRSLFLQHLLFHVFFFGHIVFLTS